MSKWEHEKKQVLKAAKSISEKGLVAGTSGNVSLRLASEGEQELLAITPSGKNYETLTVNDIQVIDFEGKTVEGELSPSSEMLLHIGIYKARKDVKAVVHTHSIFASVMAVARLEIPPILDEQVILTGGEVKVAEYAPPGGEELSRNALAALENRNAVLLANHGAVGAGKTMDEALTVAEVVERVAQIYLHTLSLNKVSMIPEEVVEKEKNLFRKLQSGEEQ
ncbi:MAG: class II aldolase/adducin family protein [Dehalococcoidia bacterium]